VSNVNDVLISVTLAGQPLGKFIERGDWQANATVTKVAAPGGGWTLYPSSRKDFGDLTVTRTYERPRDSDKWPFIVAQVNRGRCDVSETQLNADGTPTTSVRRWSGLLAGAQVNGTNVDGTGVRQMVLTVTVDTYS
jgi:hypothetical protein